MLAAAALFYGLRRAPRPLPRPNPLWLLAAPGGILMLLHALTPEIQPDAAGYHLGLVAEWARSNSFGSRLGFYEMMPLGLETLFLPAWHLAGATGAKLLHFAFFLLSLPLIARAGVKCGLPESKAVLAAVFYSATPVVMITASSAYTDAALVFFVFAVFCALLEARYTQAGLAAGFCYAIKMTGLIVPVAAIAWLLSRREFRPALHFSLASAAVALPWVARAFWLTGNPVAPLGNSLFVNDAFHAQSERVLAEFLADYGGLHGWALWRSLLWGGAALQGLIGPAALILPAGLLALRHPGTRPLAVAALTLLLPWLMNLGARFTLPALPFASLAAASVLPAGVFFAATTLHAALAWPPAMDRYADAEAWRLRGVPWQAALRVEPSRDYLSRNLWEYRFLERAGTKVKQGDTLLDLYGLPYAYLPLVPLGPLPSAQFDNIVFTLNAATAAVPETVYRLSCDWTSRFVREVRISATGSWPIPFSIAEARPLRGGAPIQISRNWFIDARPNGGASPLAMDNNPATRWSSLEPAKAGDWWAVRFDRPLPIDGFAFDLVHVNGVSLKTSVHVTDMDGNRKLECALTLPKPLPLVVPRRGAAAFLRANGIQWIAGRFSGEGHSRIVRALIATPELFGVKVVERVDDLVLFKVE